MVGVCLYTLLFHSKFVYTIVCHRSQKCSPLIVLSRFKGETWGTGIVNFCSGGRNSAL